MPVPQGYTWARELDPNAQWNKGQLTVSGKTYQPGQYYLEGGKAYLPSTSGASGTSGTSNQLGTFLFNLLSKLGTSSTATTPKSYESLPVSPPKESDYRSTELQRYVDMQTQMLDPVKKALADRLQLNMRGITEGAEAQRRLADVAYQSAQAGLGRQEQQARRGATHSVSGRGLSSSPLAEYERRKVAEAYAPMYQELEANKAAQLANIASQAALAADELAQQGREQEAKWASSIMEQAFTTLQETQTKKAEDFWKQWQTQAGVTGVIPKMYPGDPSATIRYAQQLYADAVERGDRVAMDQAHQMAEEARRSAGWETGDPTGMASAYRKTMAGLPTGEMQRSQQPWTLGPTPAEMLPYQYPTVGQQMSGEQALWPYQYPNVGQQIGQEQFMYKQQQQQELTKKEVVANLDDLKKYYTSPTNYRASLERNAPSIVAAVGTSLYDSMLEAAYRDEDNRISWRHTAILEGGGDPITKYFKEYG